MTETQCIVKMIKEQKRVWLGGEMEFEYGLLPAEAYAKAVNIAENCGYLVRWKYGHSAFSVVGGDICGQIVLDWYAPDRPGPEKIELWTCECAYVND